MKRKIRWAILTTLILLAGLIAVALPFVAASKWGAEWKVRRLVLADYRGDPEERAFDAKRFGEASWLVTAWWKNIQPSAYDVYLVDPKGKVSPMSDESLSAVMSADRFPFGADPEHKDFIDHFLLVRFHERQERLDSAADIPGHANKPLPEAIAAEIRPQLKTPGGSIVFYTYQEIAGIVRKNEFRYDRDGKFLGASCTDVGTRIGDFAMYE
ncbi:hypothetical protein [Haloferula sp. BvORR071]|uniref:hypothetical protein n=1 Tax=Haloferula sp. BvORR071 TaxID=1396141 RepID=UPI002240FCB6|nr:hypothetical protein [Haloferula sp. BvORR071]